MRAGGARATELPRQVVLLVARRRMAMIGGRHFDIDGAGANGMHAVGVGRGFGSIEELRLAGADAIAHAPSDPVGLLVPEAVRPMA